jgi:hypothetical protein
VGHHPARLTISDGWEDVSEALSMIHDSFVQAGYMEATPSGRRMILPYLAPGAAFFVAHWGDRAVGAAALLPDSPLGLPSDRAFVEEMDGLRRDGRPLLECGSLVVGSGWQGQSTLIVALLMAGAMRVIAERPHARVAVSVTPSAERFYASTLGFVRLADPRPLYGAPAVLMEGDTAGMQYSVARGRTAPQRLLDELTTDDDPAWLDDRRTGQPWPQAPLGELLAEQGCFERVLGPLAVLGRRLGWGGPEPAAAEAVMPPATAVAAQRSP